MKELIPLLNSVQCVYFWSDFETGTRIQGSMKKTVGFNYNMKLTLTIKKCCSNSWVNMVVTQLLVFDYVFLNLTSSVLMYMGTTIKTWNFKEQYAYKKAYTVIRQQVIAAVEVNSWSEIYVWSPDTGDVLTLLLGLASPHLRSQTLLKCS